MMNTNVLAIVQHTPAWVFVVLAALIVTGLQALRARVVPVWRVLIVPAIFIGWGILSVAQRPIAVPALSLVWIAAAAAGSLIGWVTTRLGAYGFEEGSRVRVPGTSVTLVRT